MIPACSATYLINYPWLDLAVVEKLFHHMAKPSTHTHTHTNTCKRTHTHTRVQKHTHARTFTYAHSYTHLDIPPWKNLTVKKQNRKAA